MNNSNGLQYIDQMIDNGEIAPLTEHIIECVHWVINELGDVSKPDLQASFHRETVLARLGHSLQEAETKGLELDGFNRLTGWASLMKLQQHRMEELQLVIDGTLKGTPVEDLYQQQEDLHMLMQELEADLSIMKQKVRELSALTP